MLGQYVQALSGMLGPCLLAMGLGVLLTVGEGRDRPIGARWRTWGFTVGLAAACAFAALRFTALIDRRSTVNLPTLVACVVFDAALVAVVLCAGRLTRDWHARRTALAVADGVSAVAVALSVFYAAPDVILQLADFVEPGDSPFTSDMLLRALGFLLGVGTAVAVAAVFRTMRTPAVRRSFTLAVLLLVLLTFVRHLTELFSLLMNMLILELEGAAFRTLILFHNNTLALVVAQACVFLIPAVASVVAGMRMSMADENPARARAHIAFRRRRLASAFWSLVCVCAVGVSLVWGTAELNKAPVLSEPEAYALKDGVATITFAQVSDGHLHRFEYTAEDGTVMRFIIIKKNGGAYGIGLDACETCGDAGYYEKDGKIICKRCDVAINLATIGFKGGCNPIPFPYKAGGGAITIQTADLDALSANFK